FITCIMKKFNEQIQRYNNINCEVLSPNELFSTTKYLIGAFDTKEEAQNFCDYMNSQFATELISMDYSKKDFGQFVPNLKNYTSNNPIFTHNTNLKQNHPYYELSLDERLYLYFDLQKEESEFTYH